MNNRRGFVKMVAFLLGSMPLMGHVGRAYAIARKRDPVWYGIERKSAITCPSCGHATTQNMGSESIRRSYHCPNCLKWLAPKRGDHCIYDSYGSVACPARQWKTKARSQHTA